MVAGVYGESVGEDAPVSADALPGIDFPVLCLADDWIEVRNTCEGLTTASKLGLKKGAFDGLLVIGSNAIAVRVKGARKLHGVGRFGGHTIWFNQRLRVELDLDAPYEVSLDAVKSEVHRAITASADLLSTGRSVGRLRRDVNGAKSVPDIIELFQEPPGARAFAGIDPHA